MTPIESALIIRGGAIGDFILTLPSVHAFREHYPSARVEFLGYTHIAALVRERYYAADVRSMEHRATAGFFSNGELDRDLSAYFTSFDVVVSFLYDPDQLFQKNLKRAGVTRIVAADCHPVGGQHASDFLAKWLPEVEVTTPVQPPRLYPSPADLEEAVRVFPFLKGPTVALHVGSGSPIKNWPVQRWLEITRWLKEQKVQVMIVAGAADDEAQKAFWKDPESQGCERCEGRPLPLLAAVLKKCVAFAGHDSGISHLCAAVGTPTVVVFGPTDPKVWAPRGKNVTVLCRGTIVSAVSVDVVKKALERRLAHPKP